MVLIVMIMISFLMGAIPFGYIVVKNKMGIDIRKEGSGNIGSTNVKRIAGKKIAAWVQFLDITKSLIPVTVALILFGQDNLEKVCVISIATVLGHIYSPFLKFKGGKGVNSLLGGFFPICPIPVLISVLAHIMLKSVTDIVAIRSIILSVVIPFSALLLGYNNMVVLSSLFVAVIIIFAHRGNIKEIIERYNKK